MTSSEFSKLKVGDRVDVVLGPYTGYSARMGSPPVLIPAVVVQNDRTCGCVVRFLPFSDELRGRVRNAFRTMSLSSDLVDAWVQHVCNEGERTLANYMVELSKPKISKLVSSRNSSRKHHKVLTKVYKLEAKHA